MNDRKLKGLKWLIKEKPKNKNDIFIHDPGDDIIMQEERVKERLQRIEEAKEAEKKRIRDLEAKKLQEEQDSISKANEDLGKLKIDVKESKEKLKSVKDITGKKDE